MAGEYAKVLLNSKPRSTYSDLDSPLKAGVCIFARKLEKVFSMADLSQQDWASALEADQEALILDVRTPQEFEAGYIPEAMNINIYEAQGFLDALEKLDKSKNYYVYCRSGNRSRQACALMNNLGFTGAFNLEGGIIDWQGEVMQ